MKQPFNDEHWEQRVLIKNALDSVLSKYSINEVLIYPIVDVLRLIFQQPHILSFFSSSTGKGFREPLYTSLQDLEWAHTYQSFLEKNRSLEQRIHITPDICLEVRRTAISKSRFRSFAEESKPSADGYIYKYPITAELANIQIRRLRKESFEQIERTIKYLFGGTNRDNIRRRNALEDALNAYADYIKRAQGTLRKAPWWSVGLSFCATQEENQRFLSIMRGVVNDVLAEFDSAPLLRYKEAADLTEFSNLFCVLRTPLMSQEPRRVYFDYSAQIILSTQQKAEISAWSQKHKDRGKFFGLLRDDPNSFFDILETPLTQTARSISDSVFSSGVVDFSMSPARKGNDNAGDTDEDKRRQRAEAVIYQHLTKHPYPFYIPVHVGGVPWLAVFTFSSRPYDSQRHNDWLHNLQVYEMLVPHISDRFRTAAKQAYLDWLGEEILKLYQRRNAVTELSEINERWNRATGFFPFDRLKLSPGRDDSNVDMEHSIHLPDGRIMAIEMTENKYFSPQVPFQSKLDIREVTEKLNSFFQKFREAKPVVLDNAMLQVEGWILHDLRSLLRRLIEDPLLELSSRIEDDSITGVKDKLQTMSETLEKFISRLSTLLSTYKVLFSNESALGRCEISENFFGKIAKANSEDSLFHDTDVEIKWTCNQKLMVLVSEEKLTTALQEILRNATDALLSGRTLGEMHDKRIEITADQIKNENDGKSYCKLSIWNSGKLFPPRVIDGAGIRAVTRKDSSNTSGLGFMIIERQLMLIGALECSGRHFELRNTEQPTGAMLILYLPMS